MLMVSVMFYNCHVFGWASFDRERKCTSALKGSFSFETNLSIALVVILRQFWIIMYVQRSRFLPLHTITGVS